MKRALLLLPLLLLAGCDRLNGVRTRADFDHEVDLDCFQRVLAAMRRPGDPLQRDHSETIEHIAHAGTVRTNINSWSYGPDGAFVLQVNRNGRGWHYSNSYVPLGGPFPRERVLAEGALVSQVDRAIERGCGLPIAKVGTVDLLEAERRD